MLRGLICCSLLAAIACTSDDGSGEPMSETTGSADDDSTPGGTASAGDEDEQDTGASGASSGAGDETTGQPPAGTSTGQTGASSTGAAMDTWENWALPEFFGVYCNQCHPAAGQSQRDFGEYEQIGANLEHIRCGVAPEAIEGCDPGHIEPGHLPIGPGPYPSDDERWRLVDWIDAGMLQD